MIVQIGDDQDVDRLESAYRTSRPPEPLFYLVGVPWREMPADDAARDGRQRAFCRLLQIIADRDADVSSRMETVTILTGSDDHVQAPGGFRLMARLGVSQDAVDLSSSWLRDTPVGQRRDGRHVTRAVHRLIHRRFEQARHDERSLRAVLFRPGSFLVADYPGAVFRRSAFHWRGELDTDSMVAAVVNRAAAALALPPFPGWTYFDGPHLERLTPSEFERRLRRAVEKKAAALCCLTDVYVRDPLRPRRVPLIVDVIRLLAQVLPLGTPIWIETPDERGEALELAQFAASPWLYVKAHLTLVFANPFAR